MQYTELIYNVTLPKDVFADTVKRGIEKYYSMLFEKYWGVDAISLYAQNLQFVGDTRQTIDFMRKLLIASHYLNILTSDYRELIGKFNILLHELTTNNLDAFYTKLNDFIVNDLAKHLYF